MLSSRHVPLSDTTPSPSVSEARSPPRARASGRLQSRGLHEHVLRAHGFTTEQMVELVRAGLATATPQHTRARREVLEVATLRITDVGRRVLAG
jgi:hypothetical protein